MKQSRSISLLKSVISTAVGFGLSLLLQWLILPMLLGVPVPLSANLAFAGIMTAVSIGRGYLLERFYEWMGWRVKLSPFAQAVLHERFRQRDVEGYDLEHDDGHTPRELAQAGAAYFIGDATRAVDAAGKPIPISGNGLWPWTDGYKPQALRRDLVRGCALGIAAGELADRSRKPRTSVTPVSKREALR
ncbi:MAG: hypothetical protein Q8L13_11610 [Bradyrhizobium sp.]|uniref:DUF7220 family protein n=1 Tax=Bradyrhizobium sp. TaxID=376 RepID=UPI00272FFFD1|nr:hypothetical protein [Bradyrhizobium sp.]MDP1866971.1 hypothetical protein [Bradyrhizobium sp.]